MPSFLKSPSFLFLVVLLAAWLFLAWRLPFAGPFSSFQFASFLMACAAVLYYAWALARGKAAPALRHPLAPWIILLLCGLAAQTGGGAGSPASGALLLLILVSFRFSGARQALALAAAASLMAGLTALSAGSPSTFITAAWLAVPWSAWVLAWALGKAPAQAAARPLPAPGLAPEEGEVFFDSDSFLAKSQASLLQMAYLAHPGWNTLLLTIHEEGRLASRPGLSQSRAALKEFSQAEGEGLFGWVLKEGKPIQASQMPPASASALPYYQEPQPVKAFACAPFFSEGSLLGALAADKVDDVGFSQQEVDFLDALGRQLVLAGQQARFSAQSQAQSRQFSRLYQVSQSLGQDLDWDKMLGSLDKLLARLLSFDSFYLALRDPEEGRFAIAVQSGYREEFVRDYRLDPASTLGSWILNQAEPVLFNAGQDGIRTIPAFLSEGLAASANSCLLIPFLLAHEVRGVLKLDTRNPAGYTAADKEVAGIFASQAAVALENSRLYTRHKQLATTDGLTGLYNHRYFQERLGLELTRAGRSGETVSLALMDIDFFKKFNDTFGHQEGDEVLKRVARLLKDRVRAGSDVACRYGGEEFVLVLPGADLPQARQIADGLRDYCAKNLIGGSGPEARAITLSVGVSTFPLAAKNQRDLIHLADQALYHAKQTGRNRVCTYKEVPPSG